MDVCGVWFPSQVDVAQGSQSGQLHMMAVDYDGHIETLKGHLNQTRKKLRSTKPALIPLEISDATTLRGKTQRDIFMKVYDVRETIFSDRTGKFLKKSQ